VLGWCWCEISGFGRAGVEVVTLLGCCTCWLGFRCWRFRTSYLSYFRDLEVQDFSWNSWILKMGQITSRNVANKLPTYTVQHPARNKPFTQLLLTRTPAFQIKWHFSSQTQQLFYHPNLFVRWEILTKASFYENVFYCFILYNCYYFNFHIITL
jgi:hypothetical protein